MKKVFILGLSVLLFSCTPEPAKTTMSVNESTKSYITDANFVIHVDSIITDIDTINDGIFKPTIRTTDKSSAYIRNWTFTKNSNELYEGDYKFSPHNYQTGVTQDMSSSENGLLIFPKVYCKNDCVLDFTNNGFVVENYDANWACDKVPYTQISIKDYYHILK